MTQLTIVGHGENRNLGDGTVSALDSTGSLVESSQISVEVTRVTSSTGNFFSSGGDFSQSIGVADLSSCTYEQKNDSRRHIGHDDQDVLLQLVSEVLGSSQSETRCNDSLNPGRQSYCLLVSRQTYVGSEAKLTKRVLLEIAPLSSKSCLKNLAVSMLTPIAAKTIEKLSSCPS